MLLEPNPPLFLEWTSILVAAAIHLSKDQTTPAMQSTGFYWNANVPSYVLLEYLHTQQVDLSSIWVWGRPRSNSDNRCVHPSQFAPAAVDVLSHQEGDTLSPQKYIPRHRDVNRHSTIHQLSHHHTGTGHTKYAGHKPCCPPNHIALLTVVIGILAAWTHALKIAIFVIRKYNRVL